MLPRKTIRRALELVLIIAKNVGRYGIQRLALLAQRPGMDPPAYADKLWHLKGRSGRVMFEDMGATFIKLAQILSTRRDLFPPAALKEFEKLQDEVPPFDGALVPLIFERDFGKKIEAVFEGFDLTPVASASVAQVHHGVLKNGREVAVKVIRPGIEAVMIEDLKIVNAIVKMAARIPFYESPSLIGFSERFCEMVLKQLDLTIEAENNRRYQEYIKDEINRVRVPQLIDEYCSKNIMTMEFVRGVKPTEIKDGDGHYHVKKLAENSLYIYYSMVLYGLIHADLHPGNMLISPEHYYWIFDLGLVDVLDWEYRKGFFEAWFSTFNGEGGPLARLILNSSISHGVKDMEEFEAEVGRLVKTHLSQRIQDIEFGAIMMAIGDLQRRYKIVSSPALTSIGVSLASVEGLARYFDPELNIARTISPHLKKFLRKIYLMDPKLRDRRTEAGERMAKPETGQAAGQSI
ncbi:MAG: hypothetical protein A2V67_00455 [Deltaproteobacteria bacterium RBG_13_61_14]|nr:MAG: hypothetical protein A2V67_00455 [Deltaproteobacteria bacterium RBG_13_61_14]